MFECTLHMSGQWLVQAAPPYPSYVHACMIHSPSPLRPGAQPTRPRLSSAKGQAPGPPCMEDEGRSSKMEGPMVSWEGAKAVAVVMGGRSTSSPSPPRSRGTNLSRWRAAGAGCPGAMEEGFLGREDAPVTDEAPPPACGKRWPGTGLVRERMLAICCCWDGTLLELCALLGAPGIQVPGCDEPASWGAADPEIRGTRRELSPARSLEGCMLDRYKSRSLRLPDW